MEDKQRIHIWQLPEKTDNIDKSNSIMMIHDSFSLKKIAAYQLYEYMNQDYKIDIIIQYFEDELNKIADTHKEYYETCEEFLINYEKIVKEFQKKFKDNEDNIRELDRRINKLSSNNMDIVNTFNTIENKFDILLETISNFKSKVSELKSQSDEDAKNIKHINQDVSNLTEIASQIYINSGSMRDQITNIRNNQEKTLDNNENTLSKKMQDEYDRILAIIDYYHHIHVGSYTPDPEPDPTPDPEPEPKPDPKPDPDPDPDPEPEPKPDPDPEPTPDPEPEPKPDPEPDPEPSLDDILIDFTYVKDEDGNYHITGWKETLNGEPSTICVIPDTDKIKIFI